MRIAVTGAGGQLGRQLVAMLAERHEVHRFDHGLLDVRQPAAIETLAAVNADVIVHAAAWTDVDGCAKDPERAFLINGVGTRNVCLACQRSGAAMLYVSTNEVFDGSGSEPYLECARVNPVNAYGRSKLAGEDYVRSLLSHWYIVRTAWIFGPGGNNFVTKILRRAHQVGALQVVTDEIASPTYTADLAHAIGRLLESGLFGTYHFTNSGVCSRFEYACEALVAAGLDRIPVQPIALRDFARASTPPLYTALRNLCGESIGITLRPWREAVHEYVEHELNSVDHHSNL